MSHDIRKCRYCEEMYCVRCSEATNKHEFCCSLCEREHEKECEETADNERLEGISFDRQRC